MCKISVVVPIYNVKQYIDECVMSLVAQTLEDIDIILVDDGSTDGSSEICDRYALKYSSVRVIHKVNGGLGSARNVGLDAAIGKYVYFIDGDDSLTTNALESLYNLAEDNSLDLIMFSAECFCDGLGINYNVNQYKRTKCLGKIATGKELFLSLFRENEYYASIPLRLYRTDYLQCKKYRFPETIIHEDEIYAYWSLIQADRVTCISDRFYNRRYRAGSIMTSKKAFDSSVGYIYTWKEIIKSLDELNDWEISEIQQAIKFANSRLSIAVSLFSTNFSRYDRKRLKPYIKEIQYIIKNSTNNIIDNKQLLLFTTSPNLYRLMIRLLMVKAKFRLELLEYKKKQDLFSELRRIKKTHRKNGRVAILIGTPIHGNLGDQAIVLAEKKMLSQIDNIDSVIEISSENYLKYADLIQRFVSSKDLIILDGGGSMGTLWVHNEYRFRDVVNRFQNNRVFIFPQTIFYGNEGWRQHILEDSIAVYSRHNKLTIFCRDYDSYIFSKQAFRNNKVIYMPDMVLFLYPSKVSCIRQGKALVCFRDDIESVADDAIKNEILNKVKDIGLEIENISTLTGGVVNRFTREEELNRKLVEFSSSKLVVTDRLHAMIFCALTGTPCVAIDNLSRKVSGQYKWIEELPYICMINNKDDIEKIELNNIIKTADNFLDHLQINEKYNEMKEIIRNA